jgi:hypothetical protein
MPEEPDAIQIPAVWIGGDETPILLVNQFLGQFQDNEFILTFGQFAPPALIGTEKERREQVKEISFVPVKALARFTLTRSRLEELIGVLEETLKNHEKNQEMRKEVK